MDKNEMRITPEEKTIIEQTFGNNTKLLKLMRKIFLPTYDFNAPIGQVIDLWMTVELKGLSQFEKEVRMQARNELILHIEARLMELQALSQKTETVEEALKRQRKDSTK